MKYQISLFIQGVISISFICVLLSCDSPKSEMKFIIEGNLICPRDKYSYNLDGFVHTPYGKVNMSTVSYFKDGKLVSLLWNRANGFLEYSIQDLKRDSIFYQSLHVDTIFSINKERFLKYQMSIIRNDTIFYRCGQKVIISQ